MFDKRSATPTEQDRQDLLSILLTHTNCPLPFHPDTPFDVLNAANDLVRKLLPTNWYWIDPYEGLQRLERWVREKGLKTPLPPMDFARYLTDLPEAYDHHDARIWKEFCYHQFSLADDIPDTDFELFALRPIKLTQEISRQTFIAIFHLLNLAIDARIHWTKWSARHHLLLFERWIQNAIRVSKIPPPIGFVSPTDLLRLL